MNFSLLICLHCLFIHWLVCVCVRLNVQNSLQCIMDLCRCYWEKKKSERPIILREQNSGQNEKSENHTHSNTRTNTKIPVVCMYTFQIEIHINNYKNENKIKSKVIDQVKTHTKPFVNSNWNIKKNSLRFLLLWLLLLFIKVTKFGLLKKIIHNSEWHHFCFCASMNAM